LENRVRNSNSISVLIGALCFAVAAMMVRFIIRDVESRFQILFFWLLALVFELVVESRLRVWPIKSRFFLNGIAATLAIVAAKWLIEGLPPLLGG
jgi:uncharacterized membrane protein YoaK (UPF0700 family)